MEKDFGGGSAQLVGSLSLAKNADAVNATVDIA
jgi:hypothetical protein